MGNDEVHGGEALCCAARDGALEIVQMLLDAKVNVEGALVDGSNPVEWAAREGHSEVVRVLLAAGCRLEGDRYWTLRNVAESGDADVLRVLLEGAQLTALELENALLSAIIEDHVEVVQILLAAGVSSPESLCTAVSKGNEEMVRLLLSAGADVHQDDGEAWFEAARQGRLEVTKVLLEAGADIHAGDDNALLLGAHNGRLELVKFLLASGANPHTFNVEALLSIARDHHVEVVDVLMEARGEGDCLSLLLANDPDFSAKWGPLWDEPPLRLMGPGKRRAELLKVLLNNRHLGAVHKAVRSAQEKGRGNVILQWAADARLGDRKSSWP
ncbi:hypothetical protein HK104_000689 [Borealophlyctis nickersoniae]|nr:hypothetical protein HK104_000689 [Borealophlyctis nickersoniae]